MRAFTNTLLFGRCKSMLNYIETEINQMDTMILLRQCHTKSELGFCLTQQEVDVVVVGLVSDDLKDYCADLKSRFEEVNFLFISNDYETASDSLTILEDRFFESKYNASVSDLADEINVIHHQDWLPSYDTFCS